MKCKTIKFSIEFQYKILLNYIVLYGVSNIVLQHNEESKICVYELQLINLMPRANFPAKSMEDHHCFGIHLNALSIDN